MAENIAVKIYIINKTLLLGVLIFDFISSGAVILLYGILCNITNQDKI